MASLPPVPLGTPSGDNINMWADWYSRIRDLLNGGLNIRWDALDKTGSQLSDIATRPHSQLQSIQGSSDAYHVSSTQYTWLSGLSHNGLNTLQGGTTNEYYHLTSAQYSDIGYLGNLKLNSKAGDPTTSDITAGAAKLYKNTSTSAVKLWVNDGGTLKSVTLT